MVMRDKCVRTISPLRPTQIDGSSVGMKPTNCSDVILIPDEKSLFYDPIREMTSVFAFIKNPDGSDINEDYRTIAKKAMEQNNETKGSLFGIEPEAYVLDKSNLLLGINKKLSDIKQGEYYNSLEPIDTTFKIREKIVEKLLEAGFSVESHHSEVGPSQFEISWECSNLLDTCDKFMLYKYIAENICNQMGCEISFSPKKYEYFNGSGLHHHVSLPCFSIDKKYMMAFANGLIAHYDDLLAVCCVSDKSPARLIEGFEAPTKDNNAIGLYDRTKTIRIPYGENRIEYRLPDPSCLIYKFLPLMLKYGLEGIDKLNNAI
ncbi:hypothetical protein LCGC14_2563060 [marine sediment metagenome]|uniref:GS catalytic domain-containing protein n=1 Tax=marine sediment metagenome TaxID=412755 RepID=A0A0F9AJE9_9ZZZZ